MGYMNRRHGLIRHSAIGLQTLSNIVFAMALSMSQLSWAATSPVTIGGPFTLTAPDGTTVTDETYRGKWLLVYFGYTFCPDSCPMTLNEIAIALKKLGPVAAKLQPLFITIDPQRDTPEVLREYSQSFDPRIVGLTGSPRQIDAVTQEYGAYSARHKTGPGPDDYVMDHRYLPLRHGPRRQIRPRFRRRYLRRSDRGRSARTFGAAKRMKRLMGASQV